MCAAKAATLPHGGDRSKSQICDLKLMMTQADAAELFNVSKRSVESARVVIEQGTPELIVAVEQDKVSVSLAEKMVEEAPEVQRLVAEKATEGSLDPPQYGDSFGGRRLAPTGNSFAAGSDDRQLG
jgi:hypothetical protein